VFQGTSVESEVAFTSFRFPETKSAHLEFSPLLALATTARSHLCRLNNNAGCDMTDKSECSFAVVRFNERTYQSGGVVAVIKGIEAAQETLNDFDWCQSEESRREGWRYFLEETELRPGMDPEKATKLRQVRLDLQESPSGIRAAPQ